MWYLFPIAIVIIILFCYFVSPSFKGKKGEFIVKTHLKRIRKDNYFIINNLIIPNEDRTSQIDHIYFCKSGIYCIETKNYSGEIYGNDKMNEWVQIFNYGKSKFNFYSPVKQNNNHVKAIKNLIDNDINIYSIVIFIQGNINKIDSSYVYSFKNLKSLIRQRGDIYSLEEINEVYKKLYYYKINPVITEKGHIKGVYKKINDNKKMISNGYCPKCGSKLIVKKGKYGDFLACENFPSCRFTESLNK